MPNPLQTLAPASVSWPWRQPESKTTLQPRHFASPYTDMRERIKAGEPLKPPDPIINRNDFNRPIRTSNLWKAFRKELRNNYGMNDRWIDGRAGSLKPIIGELQHLQKYVQKIQNNDDRHAGNLVRDLREAAVKSLVSISDKNDLHINEGVFRRFITAKVPELDGKEILDIQPTGGTTEQDPELEDLTKKLMAWFQ